MSKLLLHFCALLWCADCEGIGGLPQSRDRGQIIGSEMHVAEGVAAERLLNSSKMSFVILIMLFV
jgi:hypothetical protein